MSNLFWAAFYLLVLLRLVLYWRSARPERELAELEFELSKVKYERDRAQMNGGASAHLAEYRMHRILELESQLEALRNQ
jgi:hypothetical protein